MADDDDLIGVTSNGECQCGRVLQFDDLEGVWYCPDCDDDTED